MKHLYLLYDHTCGLCCRAAAWIERQPSHFPITCLARGLENARSRFPTLNTDADELIAVSDAGDVYRGDSAYLITLYALKQHRVWSFRLASAALRPLARVAVRALAAHRKDVSRILGLHPTATSCESGSCEMTPAPPAVH